MARRSATDASMLLVLVLLLVEKYSMTFGAKGRLWFAQVNNVHEKDSSVVRNG